ncbi:50S ribosomal protein L31 [Buchnera aphidicola]|uniref:Large ribosomal subunit protein bL31 n=1 Tax=Buchnera aphidicola subsp. Tuberolachnus salignus TaxID=98804 RepID=A0A160SX35_BUCTT|nr:50S ribosomal protein L31 [Buchnera aphidicola]CUR53350.1 50S ribosomal protein L31 [Buchnera aphidicola (Tuberolachnus salignus)]
MKKNIHPFYKKILVTCSCGFKLHIFSTKTENINLDICSQCHPFYTGKQRTMNTGGRVQKFQKRFSLF